MRKYILFLVIVAITLSGCVKEQNAQVTFDYTISNETVSTVDIDLKYSVQGGDIEYSGITYSYSEMPFIDIQPQIHRNHWMVNFGDVSGSYKGKLTGLEDNGYYFFRFFVVVDGKAYYSEQDQFHTLCPGLGEGPAGGYLIYDDGNGGGLEAAPFDIYYDESDLIYQGYIEYSWGCQGSAVNSNADSIGAGSINTAEIIAMCNSDNCAARGCDNFSFNGFDDWYLPSLQEMQKVYEVLYLNSYGKLGKQDLNYWTSNDIGGQQARRLDFYFGNDYVSLKSEGHSVRPIRKF